MSPTINEYPDLNMQEALLIYRALESYIDVLEDTFAYADNEFKRQFINNEISRALAVKQKIGSIENESNDRQVPKEG